jgi:hypothetical protein
MESVPVESQKLNRVRKSKKKSSNILQAPNDTAIPISDQSDMAQINNNNESNNFISQDTAPIYQDISQGWHCCFGPIANMACGWPQGSCTALLTVVSVFVFIGGMIVVLAYGIWSNNVNVVLAVLAVLTNGFSFTFGHYLGKSAASTSRIPTTRLDSPTTETFSIIRR